MIINLWEIITILNDSSLPDWKKKVKLFHLLPQPDYIKVSDIIDEFNKREELRKQQYRIKK